MAGENGRTLARADMLSSYVHSYFEELRASLREVDCDAIEAFTDALLHARRHDRQIFIMGNGGSAAAASHMACDLGKGTAAPGDPHFRRFRAISLTDNAALLSAIGNDISFRDVFVEQLRLLLNPHDVVVAISASGNSPNIVAALEFARQRDAITVGLLGFDGGKVRELVDIPVVVSSRNYGVAEDMHVILQHVVTQHLRRTLAGSPRPVLFLDRDGVINERPAPHSYVMGPDDFRLMEGVGPALKAIGEMGFSLVVVTNQQGVGKGIIAPETLGLIHERMITDLAAEGVTLDGIFTCPHLEADGCACRKPRPGLIYRALNQLNYVVDLPASLLVGDSETDVRAGLAAGLRTIQIGESLSTQADAEPTYRAQHLADVLPLLAAEGQVIA